jgi:hypothetical protein
MDNGVSDQAVFFMSLFNGHQIVNINAFVFNPVKRRVTVADMQTVNGILSVAGEPFFVPIFSGLRISGKECNLTRVLSADFFSGRSPRKASASSSIRIGTVTL